MNNATNASKTAKTKKKNRIKLAVDILMSAALLFLMSYQIYGGAAHEIVGCAAFVVFITHHALNARWHKNIARGKYSIRRAIILIVDMLVFACMVLAAISGIAMSGYVFAGASDALSALPFHMRPSTARMVHMVSTHWGYLLVAVHLGLHCSAARTWAKNKGVPAQIALFAAVAIISAWGVWAFISRKFTDLLFYKTHFMFSTEGDSPFLFYVDYAAIAVLCVFVVQCVMVLVERVRQKKK